MNSKYWWNIDRWVLNVNFVLVTVIVTGKLKSYRENEELIGKWKVPPENENEIEKRNRFPVVL